MSATIRIRKCLLDAALLAATGLSLTSLAQTEADLAIQIYTGLRITGEVGKVYSVEYVNELDASEDWKCLEFVQLLENPHFWTDKSAPVKEKRFYRAVRMDAPANMVWVPPGTFRMGTLREGDGREVTISRGFWMGRYEVTQDDYQALMGNNPSWFNGDRTGEAGGQGSDYGIDLNRPVEQMGWDGAVEYCSLLTARERASGRIPANAVFRLPTSAEWEHACRAETSTRFSFGDDLDGTALGDYAWYDENSLGTTQPVGQKLPNAWSLHDMHGNVFEYCQDFWGENTVWMPLDPQGPSLPPYELPWRVLRGGNGVQQRIDVWSSWRIRLWSNGTDGRVGLWRETRDGVG